MAAQLAFALITPHTLQKSRTGGVIARLISRTGLDLVGARMLGPSKKFASAYAELADSQRSYPAKLQKAMTEYIRHELAPNPDTGRPRRAMLLLLSGPDAIKKVRKVVGSSTAAWKGGDTIRGSYGDYVTNEKGQLTHFEPAVLIGADESRSAAVLQLFATYSGRDGGIIENADDVQDGKGVESTLVMLKPDNFRFPSLRPGHIIDILSGSGLSIIGMKKFSMSVAQAEEFYGPVRAVLREKFTERIEATLKGQIEDSFSVQLDEKTEARLTKILGPLAGDKQFENIVEFMTGHRPADCKEAEKAKLASEHAIALVYRGRNAVKTIRKILGPTDPAKAEPGTVRREYGSNIMVNAAHASDSPKNAQREIGILNVAEDSIRPLVRKHLG